MELEYIDKTNAAKTCMYCGDHCGRAKDYVPCKDLVVGVEYDNNPFPETPCVVSACQRCKSLIYMHRMKFLTVKQRHEFITEKLRPRSKMTQDQALDIIAEAKKLEEAKRVARNPGRPKNVPIEEMLDREKMTEEWLAQMGANGYEKPSTSSAPNETLPASPVEPPEDF